MTSAQAYIIVSTDDTSADNSLADTIPTTITHDRVVQTNKEGEPLEYRAIKTTEKVLEPKSPPEQMSTKTTTTTTTVEEVPTTNDYVVKEADVYKPIAVVSDSTSVNSANNQIVGTTASGSLTTPGKIVGDMETVVAEHHVAKVAEPVTKKVTKTETTETKK
jgi:hypothetical protein